MIMHFQTWDNGKYGRIWPAVGDDYSWKFTEIVNGCARDEDFENSPVIASHFIGYCINNEPSGDGDIYTPFFSRYYQERLEHYRKMCLHDIKLVRNPKELEKRFLAAHIEEERRMFEASQTLFDYYQRIRSNYTLLYFGYMDFLNEKMPRYYVFREYQRPRIFQWREFDKVSVDCRSTDAYLDQVLSLNLGRVFVPYNYGGITTTDADLEQIKSVYGASENPQNLFYIFVNPTDKKSVARAIYDDFRLDMESRGWHNQAEKKLALEHAERWWEGIEAQPDNMGNIDIIRQQLRLCLETITDANKSNHAPFFKMNYEPLEDDTEIGLYDTDGFGYPAHQFYRLGDDDFSAMMDAFNKWVVLDSKDGLSNGVLRTSKTLESIFLNDRKTLEIFLNRIKSKKGAKIVDEVVALEKLGKIDDDERGETLRKELATLGYKTTTKQNWNAQITKQGRTQSSIREIQKHYQ